MDFGVNDFELVEEDPDQREMRAAGFAFLLPPLPQEELKEEA
jgi:hypothetical protein